MLSLRSLHVGLRRHVLTASCHTQLNAEHSVRLAMAGTGWQVAGAGQLGLSFSWLHYLLYNSFFYLFLINPFKCESICSSDCLYDSYTVFYTILSLAISCLNTLKCKSVY